MFPKTEWLLEVAVRVIKAVCLSEWRLGSNGLRF